MQRLYTLVIALGMSALALLTSKSVIDLFQPHPAGAVWSLPVETKLAISDALALSQSQRPYVEAVWSQDLRWTSSDIAAPTALAEFDTLGKRFEQADLLAAETTKALALPAAVPPQQLELPTAVGSTADLNEWNVRLGEERQTRVTWMETWRPRLVEELASIARLNEAKTAGVQGTDAVCAELQASADSLDKGLEAVNADLLEIAEAQTNLEATQTALMMATAAFDAKNYDQCVSLLSTCKPPLPPEVKALQERSQFWRDSEPLLLVAAEATRKRDYDSMLALAEQIEDVAAAWPNATSVAQEMEQRERMRNAILVLRGLTALHEIEGLGFQLWLPKAHEIAQVHRCRPVSQAVRIALEAHLRKAVAGKKTTKLENLQQARLRANDSYRLGKFVLKGGGEFYLYWPDIAGFVKAPAEPTDTIAARTLSEPPTEPIPVQCIRKFEAQCIAVNKNPTGRAEWMQLLEVCNAAEAMLNEFVKYGGEKDINFVQEINFATFVLDAWDETIGPIVAEK